MGSKRGRATFPVNFLDFSTARRKQEEAVPRAAIGHGTSKAASRSWSIHCLWRILFMRLSIEESSASRLVILEISVAEDIIIPPTKNL